VTGPPSASRDLPWEAPAASREGDRHAWTSRARLPEDWVFFEGHFRGYPVLAGVAQLHELVLPCLRWARADAGALRELSGVKFPARIRPGDVVEVTLRWVDASHEVDFEIARGDVRCTHGRLSLDLATGADER